jgi:hypothetical protein
MSKQWETRIQDGTNVDIIYYFYEKKFSYAWFGLFPKSAGLNEWGIWAYIKHVPIEAAKYQKLSLKVDAYGDVGEWEVRFYKDGGNENIAGKLPIFVNGERYYAVKMELDKYEIEEGDAVNITYTVDRRVPNGSYRFYLLPKSSPIFVGIATDVGTKQGTTSIFIPVRNVCGPQEIRFIATENSFTPRGRIHFNQTCQNPSTIHAPRCARDGTNIEVEYNCTTFSSREMFICMYPAHMQVEQHGKKYPISGKGSITLNVDSGQNPTGDWEIRLLGNSNNLTIAVKPLVVIGAKEAFFTKMLLNVKFMEVDIVTQS